MKYLLVFVFLFSMLVYAQDTQVPGAPQIGSSVSSPQSGHSATLKWQASNQKVNYRVWRSTTLTGTYTEIKTNIQVLTYLDKTVTASQTYYYKVDCRNPTTNLVSGYSNIVKAVVP